MQKIAFSLNKEFYNKKVIEEALEDFSEICKGDVDDNLNVEIKALGDFDFDLKDEFCNYVLGLMNDG